MDRLEHGTALEWKGFEPFQKVTLLDMRIIAREAILAMEWLTFFHNWGNSRFRVALMRPSDTFIPNESNSLTDLERNEGQLMMHNMAFHAKWLKLRQSPKAINSLLKALEDKEQPILIRNYIGSVKEIERLMRFELEDVVFGFIPPDRIEFFQKRSLFDEKVWLSFPSARIDIREAGNCYAHGLNTACVFHLMRAVEIGAREMIRGLNAKKHLPRPLVLCDWGDLVMAIQEGLKALRVNSRTTRAKKDKYEFFNDAAAQFMNFKDAWRNNVSHTRHVYDSNDAKKIINNTEQFLRHLARRLKEPQRPVIT